MRKTIGAAVGFAMLLGTSSPAVSGFVDGNAVYKECQAGGDRSYCQGIITGLTDMASFMIPSKDVCFQEDVTLRQMRDIYIQYLEHNANTRHRASGYLFYKAMKEAFPCP